MNVNIELLSNMAKNRGTPTLTYKHTPFSHDEKESPYFNIRNSYTDLKNCHHLKQVDAEDSNFDIKNNMQTTSFGFISEHHKQKQLVARRHRTKGVIMVVYCK